MKILVAAASPWSGLADTAMLLAEAGLKPALPAPVGADVFQSAADWHTQLLQTLDLHPEGLNATGPLPVGKLWEDMAVGLLRANLGPADWFMADTRATWALDFWASIDPQARFLLLYLPAEAALYTARQQALATQPKGTQAAEAWDATYAAQAWLRHNRQLLRTAQTQAARTLLVNAQQAQLHPQRLLTTVASALGVQVPASAPDGWDAPIYLSAPIEALVAPALAAELRALSRQLREAQTPLLSGGTQLVLAPEAQVCVAKAPSRLGWLGKNKQAEQALASTSAELAHTQADLGHAQDLITALAAKKERLHHSLVHVEQAHSHTLAVLQQAQEQAQENTEQLTAALVQAQGELTLANAQLHLLRTELQIQKTERQTQTGVLTQQISTLKAQLDAAAQQATSVQQAKASEVAELTQESELLLQQLHQVQEELEKFFHEREALKPKLAAAEQANAQAEKARAEAEKKAAELTKQAQEAKVAKELAEKAKTAAEQGKALADKAWAEAEKKAAELTKQTQEAKAAKKLAEIAKTVAEQGKAQAESAKAEAEKKATDLAKQVQEAKTAKEQADKAKTVAEQGKAQVEAIKAEAEKKAAELTQRLATAQADLIGNAKAIRDSQQENELLLHQLHQVQEELERHYLRSETLARDLAANSERFNRVLVRLPTWADADELSATVVADEPEHKCLSIVAKRLWVGQDSAIEQLQFLYGVRDSVPYLEFRPGADGVPKTLLPWPQQHEDETGPRLLLAPNAPGELGRLQQNVVAGFTARQWRFVRSLLTLVGSQVGRLGLGASSERTFWAHRARDLGQALDCLSPGLHFEAANVLAVLKPRDGVEVLRLAIQNLETKATRMPLLVFEVGVEIKTVRNKLMPQAIHLEFRQWKSSSLPFNGWVPNGKDDTGDYLRLRYGLTPKAPPPRDLSSLQPEDLDLLKLLLVKLPSVVAQIDRARHPFSTSEAIWIQGLQRAFSKHSE